MTELRPGAVLFPENSVCFSKQKAEQNTDIIIDLERKRAATGSIFLNSKITKEVIKQEK